MKYYQKEHEIEAFIFGVDEYPEWFQAEVDKEYIKIIKCACRKCQDANDYEVLSCIIGTGYGAGVNRCAVGDYVFRFASGVIGSLAAKGFTEEFAPLKE